MTIGLLVPMEEYDLKRVRREFRGGVVRRDLPAATAVKVGACPDALRLPTQTWHYRGQVFMWPNTSPPLEDGWPTTCRRLLKRHTHCRYVEVEVDGDAVDVVE